MSAAAAVKSAAKLTSFYRVAGLNYLDQLNVATVALRKVLKEPARTEALGKAQFKYRDFKVVDGKEQAPGASRRAVPRGGRMVATTGRAHRPPVRSLFRSLPHPRPCSRVLLGPLHDQEVNGGLVAGFWGWRMANRHTRGAGASRPRVRWLMGCRAQQQQRRRRLPGARTPGSQRGSRFCGCQ